MSKIDAAMSIVLLFGAAWGVVGAVLPLGLLAGAIKSYNGPDRENTWMWLGALVLSIVLFTVPMVHTIDRCKTMSPLRGSTFGDILTNAEWQSSGCDKFSWFY